MREYFRNKWDPLDYESREQPIETLLILDTEFSERFIDLMRNRMLMSHSRYGKVFDSMVPRKDGGPEKVINAIESMQERIKKYHETGNVEYLVDAGNFIMMEFMYPTHEQPYFHPTDSDQSPGRVEKSSGELTHHSNRDLL